ncbi:MAG: GNAT family N-acetyltransferase [Acidimicrobiia bacterium]|nr:GNAT family N-acetyltransferase [Acidimicrobiia bacterium]MDH5522060.1 GNAT family N-acetyltransferase [Acidimicrobiia bacterium]
MATSLELRKPTDPDLAELVDVVRAGIHDPQTMPFTTAWTDAESPELERRVLKYWWRCRSEFTPQQWDLPFVVVSEGTIVGVQSLAASNFPTLRTAETGSWLGLDHQGAGIGKEMRRAIVSFAFECLDALAVTSAAYMDNRASQQVSLATGYEPNGTVFEERRGERAEQIRYILTRQRWSELQTNAEIHIEGMEACRDMFGLANPLG